MFIGDKRMNKKCNTCNKEYPLDHFHYHNKPKNIRRNYCKKCGAYKMRMYRKTGKTNNSLLRDSSVDTLISLRHSINIELKNRGYNEI